MITKKLYAIKRQNLVYGLLEVIDNTNQVVVRFVPYKDEHITIHRYEENLLKTHWMSEKPQSVWDEERVAVARKIGYKNPEKHSGYVVHSPLNKTAMFTFGDHVISRRFALKDLPTKERYVKNATVANINKDNFMLGFYFSRTSIDLKGYLFKIGCSLGFFYVTIEE